MAGARQSVLIVDLYADAKAPTDFAARSPATIVKVDAGTAGMKTNAYGPICQGAAPL